MVMTIIVLVSTGMLHLLDHCAHSYAIITIYQFTISLLFFYIFHFFVVLINFALDFSLLFRSNGCIGSV